MGRFWRVDTAETGCPGAHIGNDLHARERAFATQEPLEWGIAGRGVVSSDDEKSGKGRGLTRCKR